MPKKTSDDLFDLIKQKSAGRKNPTFWYNKLTEEQLQEIKDSYHRCKQSDIPLTVMAEVIKEKYNLPYSKESVLRAIIRRIV